MLALDALRSDASRTRSRWRSNRCRFGRDALTVELLERLSRKRLVCRRGDLANMIALMKCHVGLQTVEPLA